MEERIYVTLKLPQGEQYRYASLTERKEGMRNHAHNMMDRIIDTFHRAFFNRKKLNQCFQPAPLQVDPLRTRNLRRRKDISGMDFSRQF